MSDGDRPALALGSATFHGELTALVDWVWSLSGAPHAIYVRGSAARSASKHARWDTDIYLFVEDGALPRMDTKAIALASAQRFPDLAPLDLSSFEREAFLDPEGFVVQKLALHYDGQLARGAAYINRVPRPPLDPVTGRAIRESVVPFIVRKLEVLSVAHHAKSSPTEMARTMAFCAKGVLRTIAIPEVASGNAYIRDPQACMSALIRRFPTLAHDAESIFSVIAGEMVSFPDFANAVSRVLERTTELP